jgi:hypothetical protein
MTKIISPMARPANGERHPARRRADQRQRGDREHGDSRRGIQSRFMSWTARILRAQIMSAHGVRAVHPKD